MNRFASIFLAWLGLFAAAFAGDRDAWFAVTRHTTWQHTKVITNDSHFLTARAFSDTRLVFPAAAARHGPRAENGDRKAPSSLASCVLRSSVFSITARYDHGPFGEPLSATGPAANVNPIRWATKYHDAETGLYYFGRRYFDPRTAQWLTREPLGESESLNLYSYCHNDPINKVDVLGLAEIPVWQASGELLALALANGIISEESGDNDIINTALLNARLISAGGMPIEIIGGRVCHPSMVCHGRGGSGPIAGVGRLYSSVNGVVHSSADNADMTRKIAAGMWGNARALGKDIGNLGHLAWNDLCYATGETNGFDWGEAPGFYVPPFDAEASRVAGQQQVYPGIQSDNLLVISGGFMTDALVTAGGGEAVSLTMRATGRATGWSVRLLPRLNPLNYSVPLGEMYSGMPRLVYRGRSFDWGAYLRGIKGGPPSGMFDPHAHHILFKTGNGATQQALVAEGQAILRRVGIDPIFGPENLTWAPMRVVEQHSASSIEPLVDALRALEATGGDYDDFVELLTRFGNAAARRK